MNQSHTATGQNAFFDCSTGCVQSVFQASLGLLHFSFGFGTDADDSHTAGQLGQTLLELFLVVIAVRLLDLSADLSDTLVDVFAFAGTFDDGRVRLVDGDFLRATEVFQGDVLELHAEVFADQRSAGQSCDVAQHGFAAIAETRSLDRTHVQRATQFVDHQQRQCFRVDVFSDDQQRLAGLSGLFEQRHEVANVADLLFVQQHECVFEARFHRAGIGDEVRRNVAFVELHAVDVFDFGVAALAFFDRDDAVFADSFQCVSEQFADHVVVVGRDCTDVSDFLFAADGASHFNQLIAGGFDSLFDPATNRGWVATGNDVSQTFFEDRTSEHGCGGGSVAGQVAGLLSDFDDEFRTHVLEAVFEFDFLGDGHTVFGHGWTAEGFIDDHIPAGRTHRRCDGLGQFFHAGQHAGPSVILKKQLFCHD
ncbi:archaeal DNA polymerase II, large subunit [Rhodopirellula baltica WH47]|uniref:Archaeal DNA polymerase II, large subunit n=1 Tax=Rhodopirellula baltica WH47 TaxID=991778 RepID=F2B298_RHOBT|nr:archaeal DNA polymerase II, large subunit [Rhodopirellula baltica WH47]